MAKKITSHREDDNCEALRLAVGEPETGEEVIELNGIEGHHVEPVNPRPFDVGVRKMQRSGSEGRTFVSHAWIEHGHLILALPISADLPQRVKVMQDEGKRIIIKQPKEGIPFAFSSDLVEKLKSQYRNGDMPDAFKELITKNL